LESNHLIMSCFAGDVSELENSKLIDKQLIQEKDKFQKTIDLLLLGIYICVI